jgi:P-type Ca2+ transporter type 2C
VQKGVGTMVVIATGTNSLNGRSLLALEVEAQETPLQQKLGVLADSIAKFAFWAAVGLFVFLMSIYFIINFGVNNSKETGDIPTDLVKLFILAVTVVVVAVPEGLPLAVTLSLAHATMQMLKDNNLVRNLSACETMGNATTICSDKTGTLTLNKMTVVRGQVAQTQFDASRIDTIKQHPALPLVAMSLNINSTAGETLGKDGMSMQGSKTEIALLNFTESVGYPYKASRSEVDVSRMIPFSSESKRMGCIAALPTSITSVLGIQEDISEWVCIKGASEIVVAACDKMIDDTGRVVDMTETDKQRALDLIASYAADALRTIAAAVRAVPPGEESVVDGDIVQKDWILVAIFGIEDPLRPEVVGAVASCQSAGVVVRMVTGDSVPTARAIARGCGILTADGLVMEGPEFRAMDMKQMDEVLPRLQVLARSSPLDKQILVNNLKRLGETVAVTGGKRY